MLILKDRSIFCIEDNPQNRVVFQMALVRQGASVDFERWGAGTAFRIQAIPKVDLIILDLMLADTRNGFDIFDEIRALPKCNNVPIVAVSAMDPVIAIPKTLAKGFSGFIAKPIDAKLFPQQLAAIMCGEQVWFAGERSL
jgi:CheY-like chemotaxis protein